MDGITGLKMIYLPENKGLGNALRVALENCSNELVARMDSDDISSPIRFQVQLDAFKQDSQLDIVGGSITEFVDDPSNITGERPVHLTDSEIMFRSCIKRQRCKRQVGIRTGIVMKTIFFGLGCLKQIVSLQMCRMHL